MAKIDITIDSRLIGSTKLVNHGNLMRLNMNGDPRLDGVVSRIKEEISKNNWTVEDNKREICTRIVQITHSDEFYGSYNPEIEKNIPDYVVAKNSAIEKAKKGISASSAEYEKLFAVVGDASMRETQLRKLSENELVCKQEAAVVSYAMDRVGIENDFCMTPGVNGAGHAFVQIKENKDIVETTDKEQPYRRNLSGGRISAGEVVITKASNQSIHAYGNGLTRFNIDLRSLEKFSKANEFGDIENIIKNMTPKEVQGMLTIGEYIKTSKDEYQSAINLAMGAYEKKIMDTPAEKYDSDKPITVEQAQENLVRFYAQMDTGANLSGAASEKKKFDGKLSPAESMDWYEKHGIKFDKKVKETRAKEADSAIYARVAGGGNFIAGIDKDKDGIILPEEVAQKIKDVVASTKDSPEPMSPKQVENYTAYIQKQIYGRDH